MQNYCCPRCGYEIDRKSSMMTHFTILKKPCPCLKSTIELTEEVKEYVLANRVYNTKLLQAVHPPSVANLKRELMFYKNRKDEKFFQTVLEDALNASHKHLRTGITDITTDTFHGEIKEWKDWKAALGQLIAYNAEDPLPNMHMYLFGRYNQKAKTAAKETLAQLNIQAFECLITENGVSIVDLATDTEAINYRMIDENVKKLI